MVKSIKNLMFAMIGNKIYNQITLLIDTLIKKRIKNKSQRKGVEKIN